MVEVDSSPGLDQVDDEKELLDLAREVFGTEVRTWLRKPHVLLCGKTPAEIAAAGGRERVQAILRTIQLGGVV
ncbi:DUF2384 domain-containing protein [Variovorax sp. J22P271]|nr:antitoxin Xre/MbcA/ParS toxin-binding domain-containing protein [Variovorax sp. J22P271]MDM0032357.1 DUF2384 domain-containing protein [Variovorax sp. J22P271]